MAILSGFSDGYICYTDDQNRKRKHHVGNAFDDARQVGPDTFQAVSQRRGRAQSFVLDPRSGLLKKQGPEMKF